MKGKEKVRKKDAIVMQVVRLAIESDIILGRCLRWYMAKAHITTAARIIA